MPCFNYTFIDVQKIYQDLEGLKDQLSLEKMLAIFEIEIDGLVQHKSDDDAHITMLVTEALCRKTGKPLKALIKESKRAVCLSKTYMPKKKKQKPTTKDDGKKTETNKDVKEPNQKQPATAKKSNSKAIKKTHKPYKKKDTKIKEN